MRVSLTMLYRKTTFTMAKPLAPSLTLSDYTPPAWAGFLLYALLLLAAQSLLSSALAPLHVPAPDLFVLAAAALARRWRPGVALLGAYALGLLQDLAGAGSLGLHGAGLAGAALAVLALRARRVPGAGLGGGWQAGIAEVLCAFAGQWFTFGFLNFWLRANLFEPQGLAGLLALLLPLLLGTLMLAPLWEWLSARLLGETGSGLA